MQPGLLKQMDTIPLGGRFSRSLSFKRLNCSPYIKSKPMPLSEEYVGVNNLIFTKAGSAHSLRTL